MMKRLFCAMVALCLCAGCALAEAGYAQAKYFDEYYEHKTPQNVNWVHVNASTAIRCRPDGAAAAMENARGGSEYEYMGKTQYDGDGAAWYCVYCYGYLGWIPAERCALQLPGQG